MSKTEQDYAVMSNIELLQALIDTEKEQISLAKKLIAIEKREYEESPLGVKDAPECCERNRLCKHWLYDVNSGLINRVTGEIR